MYLADKVLVHNVDDDVLLCVDLRHSNSHLKPRGLCKTASSDNGPWNQDTHCLRHPLLKLEIIWFYRQRGD